MRITALLPSPGPASPPEKGRNGAVGPAEGEEPLAFDAVLDAAHREGLPPPDPPDDAAPSWFSRQLAPLGTFADAFLPLRLRRSGPEVKSRARAVVLVAFLGLPFYGVLVQQLLASGLTDQAALATAMGLAACVGPLVLLRLGRSHVAAGALGSVLLVAVLFLMAYTDVGPRDPVLYWAAVVPLIASLVVGPRLAALCAGLVVVGAGTLFVMEASGYAFPRVTPPGHLPGIAFVSVTSATLFAFLLGWLYESHTLRELREMNARLSQLRGALQRSEVRYRSLFDNVPLGIYRTTPDGRVLMANPAFLALLGYESLEALHALESASGMYAEPAHREHFRALLERDGEVHELVSVLRTCDGRNLHVRENARAVFDGAGQALYFEGSVEDITHQRRVQLALRKSEERFRALVQHSSDIITVLDRNGRLVYLSPSVQRLLGYAPEAATRTRPLDAVHPNDRRRVALLLRRALNRRGDLPPVEFRLRHAEGHYVYVETVGANLLHDANVGGLVFSSRDVTERKRAEAVLVRSKEQAEEVARLKSTFLANMSHEIRTPLTGILGFASVLAEEVTEPQHQEFVALIEKSGHRLLDTLNSVLDLARLEAGRMALGSAPVVLADPAQDVVRLLQPLARSKGLTLEVEIGDPEAQAALDRGAVDRILTNLVGNAIKFTNTGSVTVAVGADAEQVWLSVRDTGVGMENEFMPRLFEEFEQESTGIARSHEGTGLGLSITRQLTERMGGQVEVESEKGVGSTFVVRFPRTDHPAEVPAAPVPAPAAAEMALPSGEPPAILAVDDNANTRLLIRRMLAATCRVDDVGTAAEAIAMAERAAAAGAPYAAVLLDINLGSKTTGEDVMRRLRQLPGYADAPIVAFTAYALPGDRERFLYAGFSGYLAKPFTKAELVEQLAAALPPTVASTPRDRPAPFEGAQPAPFPPEGPGTASDLAAPPVTRGRRKGVEERG